MSNALPELVYGGGVGGHFDLRAIPNEEPGMSPMQIWCNEAQERYVLAVDPERIAQFRALCERERCPHAVIGTATEAPELRVDDSVFSNRPVEMELSALLGKPPRMTRDVSHVRPALSPLDLSGIDLHEAALRVLRLPAVADKTFLITTAVSYVLLVMSTVLGLFHTVLKTTMLDVTQWVICAAVALSIIVVAEIQKAVRRRIATKSARAALLR